MEKIFFVRPSTLRTMSNGNGFAPSRLVVVRRVLVELEQRGDGDQQRPPTTGVVCFVCLSTEKFHWTWKDDRSSSLRRQLRKGFAEHCRTDGKNGNVGVKQSRGHEWATKSLSPPQLDREHRQV